MVPAPRRGELVRLLGEELRAAKDDLGRLVTLEAGKVTSEGLGEVQEMIDICDFAVGLSRQLYGLTIATERADHRMMETWHPLGVGRRDLGLQLPGRRVVVERGARASSAATPWSGSRRRRRPLDRAGRAGDRRARRASASATRRRASASVLIGGREVGEVAGRRRARADRLGHRLHRHGPSGRPASVAARFARAMLELGGNNAAIVAPSADLDLALRGIAFAAMGTAGQRCTTLRRLFVHDERLRQARAAPDEGLRQRRGSAIRATSGTLVGPLIDKAAFEGMDGALDEARPRAARSMAAARDTTAPAPAATMRARPWSRCRRRPAPVAARDLRADPLRDALSRLRGRDRAAQRGRRRACRRRSSPPTCARPRRFLSAAGSDCGIANVNIGPSGAEIGGAFGGEKETGGGREAGSDAWKAYMRRATNTINYGTTLPLAQGVKFDVG